MNKHLLQGASKKSARKSLQSGLSVVELLVSMVISLAVVAGSIQVVLGSKKNFTDQDEVTFIQTNARYALDIIGKDVRMAGYLGCAAQKSVQIANSIDNSAGGYISTHGLIGFEGETSTTTFPSDIKTLATVGTDAILVRHADNTGELDVKGHNPSSANIDLWGSHNFAKGSTLMIADATCRNVGLFQLSGPNSVPASHMVHNTGAGTSNCTKIIKGNFVCNSSCTAVSCAGYTHKMVGYGAGSKVMALVSHLYYIGNSTAIPGMPALKRSAFNANGAPSTSSEELALGVEDMEILYGVDTDNNGDVDQFRSAANMDLDSNGTTTEAEWDKALNVKISLVFRSQNIVLSTNEKHTFAGKEYNDKYMRQLVNSTFRIRNRG
jgi:type IV pilus assembly protein PilW